MSDERPYLSVVAAARNDDHGGNLLRRLGIFVNALEAQFQRFGLPTELILVEWNPPPGRPPLIEAIPWPAADGAARVRIITVPAEVHSGYRCGAAQPFYQMIAKNAGIRRAEGEFILATNVDVLLSSELWKFLAARRLTWGRMYRLDRYDVEAVVPMEASPDEQLAWCSKHLLRVNAREGTFATTPDGRRSPPTPPPGKLAVGGRVLAEWAFRCGKLPPLAALLGIRPMPPPHCANLHTNACGDFTLAHRRHWLELRGYPEFDLYSMNLDSVFCFMAHYGGAQEEILPEPMRIYHMEHGAGWTPEGQKALFDRLRAKGIPWLEWEQVLQWAAQMDRLGATMVFNREDWGLGGMRLAECQPTGSSQP
jgi:hypothetical protein